MKWVALFFIVAGIVSVLWSIGRESGTDLRNLPVIIVAGIGGAAMAVAGVIWMLVLLFTRA